MSHELHRAALRSPAPLRAFLKRYPALCHVFASQDNPPTVLASAPGSALRVQGLVLKAPPKRAAFPFTHSLLGIPSIPIPALWCQALAPGPVVLSRGRRLGLPTGKPPHSSPAHCPRAGLSCGCAHRHKPSSPGAGAPQRPNEVCHFLLELSCSHSCSNKQTP